MSEFLPELFKTYGPLSLGWPLAWYFIKQNDEMNKRVYNAFLADTVAKTELKNSVDALSETIQAFTRM